MKFAICNETYPDWPFERVCADAAECGYDGVEVALSAIVDDPSTLSTDDARDLGAVARRAGIDIVGLHWLLKAPPGLHLMTPTTRVRHATVSYLEHLARLCAAMGGSVIVLGSPKQRDVAAEDTYDAAFARAVESCRQVAETAAALDVTLALEPLAPTYTNFLTTAAEAVRLIEAVDHPGCRLHLDVFAMSSEREPIPDIIRAHGPHLAHFHANDTSLGGPGTGDVDYPPIAEALRAVDYRGWVSVEVFDMTPGGPAIARDSLAFLRSLFP
ncbi:MAG: sugar phosphate isomerase/epimerase [Planctomycetota bacterium]|nr:MAG: sugar phosphate isomerase/epimerase [Planctomycetota bacterium]